MEKLFVFFYILLVFKPCISNIKLNLLDELIFLLVLLLGIIKLLKLKKIRILLNKYDIYILNSWLLLFILGIVSTLIFKVQDNITVIIKDIILFSKFILCYVMGKLLWPRLNRDKILKNIIKIAKISTIIIFICGFISLFINIGMGSEIRYGLRAYQFLFSHYTFLVFAQIILLATITCEEKNNNLYIFMSLIILLLTLRSKAIAFIIIYLFFNIMNKYRKNIKWWHIGIAGILILWMLSNKILDYLSWGDYNLRTGLHLKSFQIAKDYFPLGAGFGTYGSNISYEYLSPLYAKYGLMSYQGFNQGFVSAGAVISDVFWPYIIGQWGILGTIIYILILWWIFMSFRTELKETNSKKYLACIYIFIYMLLASTTEAVYTNESGVWTAILLSIYFNNTKMLFKNKFKS